MILVIGVRPAAARPRSRSDGRHGIRALFVSAAAVPRDGQGTWMSLEEFGRAAEKDPSIDRAFDRPSSGDSAKQAAGNDRRRRWPIQATWLRGGIRCLKSSSTRRSTYGRAHRARERRRRPKRNGRSSPGSNRSTARTRRSMEPISRTRAFSTWWSTRAARRRGKSSRHRRPGAGMSDSSSSTIPRIKAWHPPSDRSVEERSSRRRHRRQAGGTTSAPGERMGPTMFASGRRAHRAPSIRASPGSARRSR